MPRDITRNHNVQLILDCGWAQYTNTTVFEKNSLSLLSPAVSENTNGRYWFDIREVNLNRLRPNARLLIRVVPDLFVLATLSEIAELLSERLKDHRPNSGYVWGIELQFSVTKKSVDLSNIKDSDLKIRVPLISKSELKQVLVNDF